HLRGLAVLLGVARGHRPRVVDHPNGPDRADHFGSGEGEHGSDRQRVAVNPYSDIVRPIFDGSVDSESVFDGAALAVDSKEDLPPLGNSTECLIESVRRRAAVIPDGVADWP